HERPVVERGALERPRGPRLPVRALDQLGGGPAPARGRRGVGEIDALEDERKLQLGGVLRRLLAVDHRERGAGDDPRGEPRSRKTACGLEYAVPETFSNHAGSGGRISNDKAVIIRAPKRGVKTTAAPNAANSL